MGSEADDGIEARLGAYLAELSATAPPAELGVLDLGGPGPVARRRWLRPAGAAGVVLAVALVSAAAFVYHRSTPGVIAPGRATSSASPSMTDRVTRVEVDVPNMGLTFQVARGTVLALHLRLKGGPPTSAWGANGSYSGPGEDFAPLQVPYPGDHPTASASEDYVAYSIPGIGTTHIGIEVPSTCAPLALCLPPLELITVRAVAGPLTTATVTGQLTFQCGPPVCAGPAPDATISFRNQAGKFVDGIKTDVFGDYVAELPPGTWIVSSTPTPLHVQHPTLTVGAGDIVIDDVTVSSG